MLYKLKAANSIRHLMSAFFDSLPAPAAGPVRISSDRIAIFLVAAAGLMTVKGSSFDLPFITNIDEKFYTDLTLKMLKSEIWDPKWYGHPGTLTFYMLAISCSLMAAVGIWTGYFNTFQEFYTHYYSDPTVFVYAGRLISWAFFLGSLVYTYKIAAALGGQGAGRLAILFLALCAHVPEFSRSVRPDFQLVFFVVAGIYYSGLVLVSGSIKWYVLCGAMLGLGITVRMPAILLVAPICLAHVLRSGSLAAAFRGAGLLIISAAASVSAAFLAAPVLFLNFTVAVAHLQNSDHAYHLGATSTGYLAGAKYYLATLAGECGWIVAGFAVVGIVLAVRSRFGLVLLSFPVFYLAVIAGLNLRWARWIIPVLPVMAVFAAFGLTEAVRLASRSKYFILNRSVTIAAIACVAIFQPVQRTRGILEASSRDSTVRLATSWVLKNVPDGASILVEYGTVQLPAGKYQIMTVDAKGRIVPLNSASRINYLYSVGTVGKVAEFDALKNLDYIVVGNLASRMRYEASRYQAELQLYKRINREFELAKSIDPKQESARGGEIAIYKVPR